MPYQDFLGLNIQSVSDKLVRLSAFSRALVVGNLELVSFPIFKEVYKDCLQFGKIFITAF